MEKEIKKILKKNKCADNEIEVILSASRKMIPPEREMLFASLNKYPDMVPVLIDLFRKKSDFLKNSDETALKEILKEEENMLEEAIIEIENEKI